MRFGLMVALALVAGMPSAQAQLQLLPNAEPAKPVVKTPKPDRIAATQGNFPRRMKREEIEALFFTGEAVEASGLGRASFSVKFMKNGEAERLNHKDNVTERGKWRFLGDGYCSKWGKSYEGCYTVVKDGDIYKVVRGTRAVAFWSAPGAVAPTAMPTAKQLAQPLIEEQARQIGAGKGDMLVPPVEGSDDE